MQPEVDQSGKIEETHRDTIIAASNSTSIALRIKASTKRSLQRKFRSIGKPRLFVYRTFAACVFLLLKRFRSRVNTIVIDREYPGKEALIADMLSEMFSEKQEDAPTVTFHLIGKNSPAHERAYATFTGALAADGELSAKEILEVAMKKDRESLRT